MATATKAQIEDIVVQRLRRATYDGLHYNTLRQEVINSFFLCPDSRIQDTVNDLLRRGVIEAVGDRLRIPLAKKNTTKSSNSSPAAHLNLGNRSACNNQGVLVFRRPVPTCTLTDQQANPGTSVTNDQGVVRRLQNSDQGPSASGANMQPVPINWQGNRGTSVTSGTRRDLEMRQYVPSMVPDIDAFHQHPSPMIFNSTYMTFGSRPNEITLIIVIVICITVLLLAFYYRPSYMLRW